MFHGKIRTKHAAGIVASIAWIGIAVSLAAPAGASTTSTEHQHHLHHLRAIGAYGAPAPAAALARAGTYSYTGLESLWESAGGPAWAAPKAAEIGTCESGGNPQAYNSSGATGVWQILGSVVPGNLNDPYVNALNAVAKFRASGDTFAQWVCQ